MKKLQPKKFPLVASDAIQLDRLTPAHAKPLFQVVDDNRDMLTEWLTWVGTTQSEADSLHFIQHTQRCFEEESQLHLGIFIKGKIAGMVSCNTIHWPNKKADIGYWLARAHQGQGIMTTACRTLLRYLFEELGIHRAEIRCAVGNRGSQAVAERVGAQFEGIARGIEFLNGQFVDHRVYSKLATDPQ